MNCNAETCASVAQQLKDYAWAEAAGKVKVYIDCDFLPEDAVSGTSHVPQQEGLYNNPACLRYVRSVLRERLTCKTIRSKKNDKVQFCSGR